jgi:hypothetical protein
MLYEGGESQMVPEMIRTDVALISAGHAESRSKARMLVREGRVFMTSTDSSECSVENPGDRVLSSQSFVVKETIHEPLKEQCLTPQSNAQALCSAASTHASSQPAIGPVEAIGGSGRGFTLRSAEVVKQPSDGSCLFHSLAFGINRSGGVGCSAGSLRRQIGEYIKNNPNLEIAETPMKDWVKWDSNTSVSTYADRISRSGWGGGIEMAVCSRMENVNVHVYEAECGGSGFKRIILISLIIVLLLPI